MVGLFSRLGGLFTSRPREIPPPTERVQAILDRIQAEARPCLHLIPGGGGRTRFGGEAEITGDWPRFGANPMAHLARIDLAEVRAAGGPDWLPAEGRLHVFLDLGARRQDFEPEQPGACVIRWETGEAGPLAPPGDLSPRSRIPPFPLTFQPRTSFADERVGIDWRRLSRDEERTLDAAILGFLSPEPAHQIGGYPGNLQGDVMEIECAVAAARGGDLRELGTDDPTPSELTAAQDWGSSFRSTATQGPALTGSGTDGSFSGSVRPTPGPGTSRRSSSSLSSSEATRMSRTAGWSIGGRRVSG